MTVEELIKKLSKCDPKAVVVARDDYGWSIKKVVKEANYNTVYLE